LLLPHNLAEGKEKKPGGVSAMKKTKAMSLLAAGVMLSGLLFTAYADGEDHGGQGDNGDSVRVQSNGFEDVGGYGWAVNAIKQLAKQGIIKGEDKHHFAPGKVITRAQFAALLTRFFNLPKPTGKTQDFVDVPTFSWEYPYVEAAKDYMTAYRSLNGGLAFLPNQPMNRESVAVTLTEILVHENVISMDTPDQVQQVMQYYQDSDQIAPALQTAVATAVTNKLMTGVGDQMFDPLGVLNRAQAAVLLYRVENNLAVAPGSDATASTPPSGSTTGSATGTVTVTGSSPTPPATNPSDATSANPTGSGTAPSSSGSTP
jgi:hypothetical protein